jgi:hypothetical protein
LAEKKNVDGKNAEKKRRKINGDQKNVREKNVERLGMCTTNNPPDIL